LVNKNKFIQAAVAPAEGIHYFERIHSTPDSPKRVAGKFATTQYIVLMYGNSKVEFFFENSRRHLFHDAC
jgi:hypothetical protein